MLEAALAALFLEHGFAKIEAAIVEAFEPRIEYATTSHVDHKTELQEALAREGRAVSYTVLEVEGPPHDRTFTSAAIVDGDQAGVGTGPLEEGGRAGGRQAGLRPSRARPAAAACAHSRESRAMAKLLVHITHGPEAPTRAALGFLVARAALDEGHEVSLFLAGDAVQLLRDAVLDNLSGLGTGSLRESYDAIVAGGGRFYVSGMSAKARGVAEPDLEGKPVEPAMPARLVALAFEHDRVLTY